MAGACDGLERVPRLLHPVAQDGHALGQWHWDGLDYAGAEIVMRRYAVPAAQRGEVFAQLQVLEAQALRQLNRG